MIYHSKGKTIKISEINAKFGNHKLYCMKWGLEMEVTVFNEEKYFFSIKLHIFFYRIGYVAVTGNLVQMSMAGYFTGHGNLACPS